MLLISSRPPGLRHVYLAAAGHAFAWYTIYNLFVLWLCSRGVADAQAQQHFGDLVAAAYLLPLLGGVVADGFSFAAPAWMLRRGLLPRYLHGLADDNPTYRLPGLGVRRTAILGAVLSFLGYAGLATSLCPELVAVGLLVLGAGALKPTLSNMIGKSFPAGSAYVSTAMGTYYGFLNAGALATAFVAGIVAQRYDYHAAFAIALFGEAVVIASLLTGWRRLGVVDSGSSLEAAVGKLEGGEAAELLRRPDPELPSDESKRRLVALWIFFVVAAVGFWPAYTQNGSGLNLWAKDHTDLTVAVFRYSFDIPITWFSALNGLMCALCAPPILSWFQRRRLPLSYTLAIGFALMAASFVFLVVGVQTAASPLRLVAAVVAASVSEILISTVGLVQVSALAPRSASTKYTALWLLTVAVGGKLAGCMGALSLRTGFCAMATVALGCGAVAMLLRRRLDVGGTASHLHAEAGTASASTAIAPTVLAALEAQRVRLQRDVVVRPGEVLLEGMELDVIDAALNADGTVRGWLCRRETEGGRCDCFIYVGDAEVVGLINCGAVAAAISSSRRLSSPPFSPCLASLLDRTPAASNRRQLASRRCGGDTDTPRRHALRRARCCPRRSRSHRRHPRSAPRCRSDP